MDEETITIRAILEVSVNTLKEVHQQNYPGEAFDVHFAINDEFVWLKESGIRFIGTM